MFSAEGAGVLEADIAINPSRAGVGNGEGVHRGLEGIVKDFSGVRLGEVADDDGVFEIDAGMGRTFSAGIICNIRPRAMPWAGMGRIVGAEEMEFHEIQDLGIEHVVAADETEILEQLVGEKANDGTVVGVTGTVEVDGVVDGRVEHRFEDDLVSFLWGEGFERGSSFRAAAETPIAISAVQNSLEQVEIAPLAPEPGLVAVLEKELPVVVPPAIVTLPPAEPKIRFRLAGSNTIGAELLPTLMEKFLERMHATSFPPSIRSLNFST